MQTNTRGGEPDGSGPPSDAVPDADALDHDDVYHLLQHERRRHVVRALADVDGPADVRALVERVAAGERPDGDGALPDEERQRIYVDLYQSHLPKLSRSGVVRYDRDGGDIERGPALAQVASFLPEAVGDATAETEASTEPAGPPRSWLASYALATLASVGILGLAALGSGLVSLSTGAAAAAVAGIYATVTAGLLLASTS